MLISPYLSPDSRAICIEHDVAYLDLVGNAHLEFDGVYIDRAVGEKPKSETRALRSIFSPKAGAILRVLLRDPSRAWRVADLAEQANASLGHVSNVRKALLERDWAEKHREGIVLIRPGALLQSWRENYRRATGQRKGRYTHLHGKQFEMRLSGVLNPYPQHPRAIYALNSAAQWIAPFGRDGTYTFYADEPGASLLGEALELTPARKGRKCHSACSHRSEPVPTTPLSPRLAYSAPVRSQPISTCGTAMTATAKRQFIWQRRHSRGYERTSIR